MSNPIQSLSKGGESHTSLPKLQRIPAAGVLLAAAACWVTGCEYLPEPAPPVPTIVFAPLPTATPQPLDTYVVEIGDVEEAVEVRGHVASVKEAMLYFEISGWLKEINVQPGDLVVEGDLLALLDPAALKESELLDRIVDAEYDLRFKELELAQAKAEPLEEELQRAKQAVKLAEITLQQAQAAYDKIAWQDDVGSRAEGIALQRADVAYQSAQADYLAQIARQDVQALRMSVLESKVEYAHIALDRAQKRLVQAQQQTELRAPFAGLVIAVDEKIGGQVSPFETVVTVADPAELRVETSVFEEDMTLVTLGQAVLIVLDAYPDQALAGTIIGIATQPTVWQGKNAYDVVIQFDDPAQVPATIRMGADVRIVTRRAENVIVVPLDALQGDDLRPYVQVARDGEPARVVVETGLTDGKVTEIVDGLSSGEQVVIP